MSKWEGDKKLEKRLIELYGRGMKYGDLARQLSEEFGQTFSVKSIDSRLFVLKEEGKLGSWVDTALIGALDVESSNLVADAAFLVSWAIEGQDGTTEYDIITPNEITENFGDDKRILVSLIEAMKKRDVLLTFWGTGFDIPFVRSRALFHGLDFPHYGTIAHLDLFYACRSLFKLHRKSLQVVCEFLGIPGKTHLNLMIWNKGRVGHKPSLQYILEHNLADVKILMEVWRRVKPYRKWIRKSI